MLGTLGNTRKIEVIPSYARKNKSAHGLPRQYFPQTLKTLNLSYVLDSKGTFY